MRTGKFTPYNPDHYRFPRTCEGFKGEPEANAGDWLVGAASITIAAVCAVVLIHSYLSGIL